MTQDLYYYESGYIDDSYFVYTADSESGLTSVSSVSCDASVVAGGVAVFGYGNLPAFATMTVTISHINGADLFAFSEAALSAEASRVRETNISTSGQFSVAIDAVRGIYVSAQADAQTFVSIANLRVRYSEAATSAAFSLACDAERIAGNITVNGEATLTSTTVLTVSVDKLLLASASLDSNNSLEVSGIRTRTVGSWMNSSFNVVAIAQRFRDTGIPINSLFLITFNNGRIIQGQSFESALFTPTVVCYALKNSFAVLDNQSSLVASGTLSRGYQISLTTVVSTTTNVNIIKNSSSSLQSAFLSNILSNRATRNVPTPLVYSNSELYTNIGVTSSDKKFGSGSLKIYDDTPLFSTRFTEIQYGNGIYLFITRNNNYSSSPIYDSTIYAYKSTDGINWTKYVTNLTPTLSGSSYNNLVSFKFINGAFHVMEEGTVGANGGRVWTTTDGVSWTSYSHSGLGWNSSIFLSGLISYNNGVYIKAISDTANSYVFTSTNLTTWTQRHTTGLTGVETPYAIAHSGNTSKLSILSVDGTTYRNYIYTSTNGTTWTVDTGYSGGSAQLVISSSSERCYSIATNGTTWVAVGGGGRIWQWASIGANTGWRAITGFTDNFEKVIWTGSQYQAYSATKIITSTDGYTWTTYSSAESLNSASLITFVNNNWFTGPYGNTESNYLSYPSTSSNGLTWTYKHPSEYAIKTGGRIEYAASSQWNSWKTIDFWVKPLNQSYINGGSFTLMNALSASGGWRVGYFELLGSGYRISIQGAGIPLTTSSIMSYDNWHHIRLSYNNGSLSIYVDGTRSTNITVTPTWVSDSPILKIFNSLFPNADTFIDELLITDDVLTDPSLTSFTVPTTAYQNTSNTKLLVHFDGSLDDDATTFARYGSASITSQSTVSATATITKSSRSIINAVANLSVIGIKASIATASLQATDFIVAVGGRIRPFIDIEVSSSSLVVNARTISSGRSSVNSSTNVSVIPTKTLGPIVSSLNSQVILSLISTITVGGKANLQATGFVISAIGRIRPNIGSLDSITGLSSTPSGTFRNTVNINSVSSSTVNAIRNIGAIVANLSSSTNLTASGAILPSGAVNCQVVSSMSVAGTRVRYADSNQTVTATETANVVAVKTGVTNVTSTATLTANAYRIKQFASSFEAVASELTAVNKIGNTLVHSQVTATLVATFEANKTSIVSTSATASLNVNVHVIKQSQVTLTSTSNVSCVADSGIIGEVHANATSTLTVNGKKIVSGVSSITATSTLTARLSEIKAGIAIEAAFADMDVSASVIKGLTSNAIASSSLVANAGKKITVSANLNVEGFELVIGRKFNLDNAAEWIVPVEDRTWTIPKSQLQSTEVIYVVPGEDRLWRIAPDNNYYKVVKEDRTYKIKG